MSKVKISIILEEKEYKELKEKCFSYEELGKVINKAYQRGDWQEERI